MPRKTSWTILTLLIFLSVHCDKKDSVGPGKTVKISEITRDKSTVTAGEIIKLECVATASGTLHYKWSLMKSSTVYESSIVDRENKSDTFDSGKWIKWQPFTSGEWEIEVLAYLSSADHSSSGNGSWHIFYEYGEYGVQTHCFNMAEQGKLWDEKTITVNVGN